MAVWGFSFVLSPLRRANHPHTTGDQPSDNSGNHQCYRYRERDKLVRRKAGIVVGQHLRDDSLELH